MSKMKPSKNNPDNKFKKSKDRIISSIECERCQHQNQCAEYIRYKKAILISGIGYGVKCSL